MNFKVITVKAVYNDHPRDPKFVTVIDRWLLFRGGFMLWKLKMGTKNRGHYRQAVIIRKWSLAQVWLYLGFNKCILTNVITSKCSKCKCKWHLETWLKQWKILCSFLLMWYNVIAEFFCIGFNYKHRIVDAGFNWSNNFVMMVKQMQILVLLHAQLTI